MNRIRVMIADDHETVRQGLKLLIDGQPDMRVVGEAGDGRSTIAYAEMLRPDVIVLDISMPQMNGLAAAKALKESATASAIVALTRYRDEAYVQQMMGAGVLAYVLKQSASTELLEAIRCAAVRKNYVDTTLLEDSKRRFGAQQRFWGEAPKISTREADVLKRMARGESNKEIASALDIAVKTVEVHKANAMRKLGLSGRIDVVRFAVLQGWLEDA